MSKLNIPPFVPARTVLEGLESEDACEDKKAVKKEIHSKKGAKKDNMEEENTDLLRLCHTVPLEVVNLGGKGYDPEKKDYSGFEAWLQCYYVDGMKSVRDHNGRTMWFKGDPGPMAPKESKSPKAKKRKDTDADHDYPRKKKVSRKHNSDSTVKKKAAKKPTKAAKEEENGPQEEATPRRRSANTPQQEPKSTSGRRKKNNTEPAAGLILIILPFSENIKSLIFEDPIPTHLSVCANYKIACTVGGRVVCDLLCAIDSSKSGTDHPIFVY
ncbi:endonuclease 8-like 1 [Nerophis ophidion]|uniref:endonuclease 8-like 1 n=1 Tax=Nerophis ophidion TaxID=159077 RepID=UPI002ADF31F2|nr:endonuclease 8-like 1 [Nerophis ophidion]